MSPHTRSLLASIGALGIIGAAMLAFMRTLPTSPPPKDLEPPASQTATVAITNTAPASTTVPSEDAQMRKPTPQDQPHTVNVQATPEESSTASPIEATGSTIARIVNPYPFPPESFDIVNTQARRALVNILCAPQGNSLKPISGSGVIIDPRGVILTNAHVAQYVLLAESGKVRLSCSIRSDAPARPIGNAEILYLPPLWIQEHAEDITNESPTGTGEHDYALLLIIGPSAPSERGFSAVYPDVRETIGFVGDSVLVASYPAEFIGELAALNDLYPVSSITPIQELLTFELRTADLIALGGVIEAQSGSSGGSVVNAWGRLIGILTTTSEGATTAERELRAITLSYIDRDLTAQSGSGLEATLRGNIALQAANFKLYQVPALADLLIEQISNQSR